AEYVFAILSFLMGLSSGVLCLTFAFCWTSQTVRSYSNTRSLLMVGQMLYPTTLLLITLSFFFLLCWSFFTYQNWGDISANPSQLGSSYWLGAMGLILLLVVLPVVFTVEQCIVPDPLAQLKNSAENWWIPAPTGYNGRSLSDSSTQEGQDFLGGQTRYMSFP
uniref:Si:ch211-256a21.4 n=1 Tax=Paramormyrops kingsleyae TaxID=1676925 RepID=A0A3B3QFW3_9TELE